MNIKYHFIASCFVLSGGLAMLTGCNPPQSLKEFTVENPLDINREDEALVLTRAQLNPTEKLLKPVITNGQGEYIPCQLDDLDGDGEWDELAFVYTFSPSEKTRLKVEWIAPERYPVFAPRTNARPAFQRHEAHAEGSDTTPMQERQKSTVCRREQRVRRRRAPTLRKPFFLLK